MANVDFTYLGSIPISLEIPASVTVRSNTGDLYFFPGYTRTLTDEEVAYMTAKPAGTSHAEVMDKSVQGANRTSARVED
jgi:hypothetical protein